MYLCINLIFDYKETLFLQSIFSWQQPKYSYFLHGLQKVMKKEDMTMLMKHIPHLYH